MSAIFLATGNATLGRTERDKDGNVVKEIPANFEFADDGGCVAIGPLDPDTNMPQSVSGLFGDWDAAGYMAKVLELLKPSRPVNIPDFASIIQAAIKDGVDVCDYCQGLNCCDCAVREWKEDAE